MFRLSSRIRITLAAMVMLAIALALSAAAIFVAYERDQDQARSRSAQADAAQVAQLVARGQLPETLPMLSSGPFTVIQVLNRDGQTISQSSNLAARAPLVARSQLRRATTLHSEAVSIPGAPGGAVITLIPIEPDGLTVAVATSADEGHRARHVLTTGLLIGMPALLGVGGALIWIAVGRALRPVEDMRLRAAAITATDLHLRVPQPPGDDNIAKLAVTLNSMLARLQSSSEQQRQFIGDASHELRSPITSVLVALEVARNHAASDNDAELFDDLVHEQQRVVSLVEQLLLLARIDANSAVQQRDRVNVSELATALAHGYSNEALVIECQVAPRVAVLGDRELMSRIVRNLLANATRHTHGRVRLSVYVDTDQAFIEVADNGNGIEPEDRERVFDRFVRLDHSRDRVQGGTGLGLAIVHDAVVAHQGEVSIGRGLDGVGAAFVVRMPLAPTPSEPTNPDR
jgi:signal transduction histidine kinase